jgi:uncharacterized protein
MRLSVLSPTFAICRLAPNTPVPDWALRGSFSTVTRNEDELSIVCESALVPSGVQAELPWRALKLHGPIPFVVTGTIASLTKPLADAAISVSAIATYDTDYLLVKSDTLTRAIEALRAAGFEVDDSRA